MNSPTRGWVSSGSRTRYQERNNQDQIQRTEDVLVGFRAGARLGYASAKRSAPIAMR